MFPEIRHFRRFNVVGSSGSGKSTLARQIARILELEHIEIDEVFWQPDWQEPEEAEFLADLEARLAGDNWVVDGNYSRTVPLKWARAEAVIWLDLPYWQIIYQVIYRTLRRSIRREVLWAGNQESLTKAFLRKDSVILWSITHLRPVRRGYEAAMADPKFSHLTFVRLRSRRDVNRLLDYLREASKGA